MRTRFRIVTLGLLAVIALDIPDATCDPLRIPGERPIVTSSLEHETDPCSTFCVPDCFCCSPTVPAVPVCAGGSLALLPEVPAVVPLRLTQGIPSVQDHVPKPVL